MGTLLGMASAEIDLVLDPDSQAPSVARRSLDGLGERLTGQNLEHARLLVTELVTNSVVHAMLGPENKVRLRVTMPAGMVRVEVMDAGTGFEMPVFEDSAPSVEGVSGWGLYLVDELSERWGVSTEGRTCVWFELSRHAG